MENTFSMVAKTFQGPEPVLRDELISLGAENVETGNRMVSFEGDLELMYRANMSLRTALRILKPIEKFTAKDTDELYDIVRDIEWEKYLKEDSTFAIDATVNSSGFTHSKFVTYRVKDGIVDHFRDMNGNRPSIRVSGYDFLFNVHIDEDRVTISLDSSGEPLSKRGYRDEATEAPINEALAAGIIMLTDWNGESDFLDPMCGSGTFLIEAALIAANINPGIYRQGFAFEKWPDFDADLFESIYNDDSAERPFDFKILGGDIDPEAVAIALKNVKSAQLDDMIEIKCQPFSDWTENADNGIIVMNPPYGRRLKPEDMTELYKGIGTCLKRNFPGWNAWIIGLNDDDFVNIGLKPSVKIPLLNGSLECSLREYVLFDGRYNDFRAEGGKVKGFEDEDDRRTREPKKMRRLSDDEWKSEAKRYGDHKAPKKNNDKRDRAERKDRNLTAFSDRNNRSDRERNDRPFNKRDNDRGGFDRKRDNDRGGFDRKRDNERGGFDRKRDNDRGGFDRKRDNDRGGFDRKRDNDRGGFDRRRDDRGGFDRNRNDRKYGELKSFTPKGPQIDASREEKINPVHFRSRKAKPESDD